MSVERSIAYTQFYTWRKADAVMLFPCDRYINSSDEAYFRAIDVKAPTNILFLWLCQPSVDLTVMTGLTHMKGIFLFNWICYAYVTSDTNQDYAATSDSVTKSAWIEVENYSDREEQLILEVEAMTQATNLVVNKAVVICIRIIGI